MIFKTLYPASKQLLLDSVSELDIFKYFCKDFKRVGEHFVSPILIDGRPNKGQKAARILFTGKRFVLHDFRAGQTFGAIEFASIMTGLPIRDTIKYLCDLFGVADDKSFDRKLTPKLISRDEIENATRQQSIFIDVKYTPWTKESILYWYQFGWLPYMLDIYHIYPISNFWVRRDDAIKSSYNSDYVGKLSFSYDLGMYENIFRRKIYNPLTQIKELKWKNNSPKQIIQGINQIDSHIPTLYITSSMKDCGPHMRISGYPCAVAPNSETTILSKLQLNYLKQISDVQVIYYDNDDVGRSMAKKHSAIYNIPYIENPILMPKDQSDIWKTDGGRIFNQTLFNLRSFH